MKPSPRMRTLGLAVLLMGMPIVLVAVTLAVNAEIFRKVNQEARSLDHPIAPRPKPDTHEPFIAFGPASPEVMTFTPQPGCTDGVPPANHPNMIIYGKNGPIVSIDECNGHVTVHHPDRMREEAREFWRTLQRAWPEVCAVPTGPVK